MENYDTSGWRRDIWDEGQAKLRFGKPQPNQGAHKEWRFFSVDVLEWDPEGERWVGNWEDGISTALVSGPLATCVILFHTFNSGDPPHLAMAPLPLAAASRLHLHLNLAKLFLHATQGETKEGRTTGAAGRIRGRA